MSDTHDKVMTVIRQDNTAAMSPVVAAGMAMLEANPNPETLEKLLAVQERYEANVSSWPCAAQALPLPRFLEFDPRDLSEKATAGFLSRLRSLGITLSGMIISLGARGSAYSPQLLFV